MDAEDRFEDVFQNEIIKKFCTTEEFFKFAVSKNGLVLDQHDVTSIREDYQHSVHEQKIEALEKWKQNQGADATPQMIREITGRYLKRNVASDATGEVDGNPQPDPEAPDPVQFKQNTEGSEPVSITNIHGPIHGPVLMGNQQVILGGGAAQGPPAIDPDVPALKPSSTEITEERTEITIGGCNLEFSALTVRESTKIVFAYQVDPGPAPEGHIHATSKLSCSPIFTGLKYTKVNLATWCSTDLQSICAGIFCRDNEGNWSRTDDAYLTNEGHLELHYRSIDNLAAFVPIDQLGEMEFKISCFLFNNADGKFAMAFCLADKAIENVLLHRLKNENYFRTIEVLPRLTVRLGDEVFFKITPGQQMQNTKLDIDEGFLAKFQGHISYCKPSKDFITPFYEIIQKRKEETISGEKWKIPGKRVAVGQPPTYYPERGGSDWDTNVEFRGQVRTDNYLGRVENADIDLRSYEDTDEDDAEPFWEENDTLTYEEAMKKKDEALKKKEKLMEDLKRKGVLDRPPPRRGRTNITFYGEVEAKTMITDSKNVRIDQRRYKGKNSKKLKKADGPKVEKLVVARQENAGAREESSSEKGSPGASQGPQVEEEQPRGNNDAQPIWDDCENQMNVDGKSQGQSGQSDKNGNEGTMKGGKEQFHEEGVHDNTAQPYTNDCERNGSKENDSEQTNQKTTSGLPKIEVRERRKRKNEEGDAEGTSKEKKEKSTVDGLHVFLGLSLAFCLCFIVYNSYGQ